MTDFLLILKTGKRAGETKSILVCLFFSFFLFLFFLLGTAAGWIPPLAWSHDTATMKKEGKLFSYQTFYRPIFFPFIQPKVQQQNIK